MWFRLKGYMPDSQPASFIYLSTTGVWVFLIMLVDFSLNEDDDNQHLFNCTENRQFSTHPLRYKRRCSSSWFRRERNNRRRITAILAPLQTPWYISIQVWDVIGRSVVVSTDKDDLGQGNHPRSLVSIWGTKYQIEWILWS